VISGLDAIVHHADISYDVTGKSLENDLEDPLPGFNSSSGWPTYSYYMNAWQPGGNIAAYPKNWGIAVPPNGDFVIEIHYGPGAQGLTDSTIMNLRFVTDTSVVRPIEVEWILYDSPPCLTDGPLYIPANTVKYFHQKSYKMPKDRSLISICPHQHHLGKEYRVWFETLEGDSVPLIYIPQWNFYWQKYYMFQQVQKIPEGARIMAEASFDNTTNNADNPNNPPIDVWGGPTTMDEMLMTYIIYADYQPGDEDIILDSNLVATNTAELNSPIEPTWQAFPNPFSDRIYFTSSSPPNRTVMFQLTDVLGRILDEKHYGPVSFFTYDPIALTTGIYYYRIKVNDKWTGGKLMKE
jgi:hypothetical protein